MARKITIIGEEAQYIERRGANAVADDREIHMEGRHARYEEHIGAQTPHFPHNHNEAVGKEWFDFLMAKGFIERDSELDCWLYQMGFSSSQPAEVKPIGWLRTVETARLMLTKIDGNLLESKQLTVVRMKELAAQCFTKQGEPLKLSKPKKEYSADADEIENFLPTISDL